MTLPFLASEYPPSDVQNAPRNACFHIIPVPMEQSVSYAQGTALGPQAILTASQQLEAWDGQSNPGDLGLYTCQPIDCNGDTETTLAHIEAAVRESLRHDAVPCLLGGEHTATLGALRALTAHTSEPFGIIQFDAHADLRDSYEGNAYSHACVMRRAVQDLALPLAQFGVRELCLEEVSVREQYNVICHDAARLVLNGLLRDDLPQNDSDTLLPDDFPQRVYVSFDVDALDAAIMPATGTPSPGGLGWYQVLILLERCVRGRTVIGFDVMEFAPIPHLHFADFTAAKLTYAMMGIFQRASALAPRRAR